MKRIESGDKRTKWKPRNKQAGLFMRKAREEFEPQKEYTPRIIQPDLKILEERSKKLFNLSPDKKKEMLNKGKRKGMPKQRNPKFKGNKKPPRT